MLSHEGRRASYDHERWLSGRFKRPAAIISPAFLTEEIRKLNAHIQHIDVYRMNKQLLHQYLLFMLSDEKVAILHSRADSKLMATLAGELLKAISPLPYYYALDVLDRMKLLKQDDDAIPLLIARQEKELRRLRTREKLYPWLALLVSLLICIAMYRFARR